MSDHFAIILCQPSHPGNIGAAARAMKTMGLRQLNLVQPKQFPDEAANARATHALDVLERARVFDDIGSAIQDAGLVLGTTARSRTLNWPVYDPKAAINMIAETLASGQKVACMFGNERTGLHNHELSHCHALIHIPTDPACSALNLAAAVQIIAYEYAASCGHLDCHPSSDEPNATSLERQNCYTHLEQLLHAIHFFQAHNVDHIMGKLKCLLNRSQPKRSEVALLRGIIAQCLKHLSQHS